MNVTVLLESVIPAAALAAASGFMAMKIAAAKMDVMVAALKAQLDAHVKELRFATIAIAKRDTEMETVHRELRGLQNLTDAHSREISELNSTLARMESKLDMLLSGVDRRRSQQGTPER